MSLDPPTYLNSLQNNIRARPIPWEGAVRAGTITENDLKRIKAVDKVRKDQRRQTVEADKYAYQSLLLGGDRGKSVLESAAKRADVIQYILVLASDLVNGIFSRSQILLFGQADNMQYRRSLTCFYTLRAPKPIQAFPTAPQPFDKSRRPHSTVNLLLPCQPDICCPDGWLKVGSADQRSSAKTLHLPLNPDQESR